jgi:hypothetical protein
MGSILKAWEPIWNGLAQDPQYRNAVRALFSDHGERFHNVANGFQLQGVHGFDLDPWECRVALLMAGPGFSDRVEARPRQGTISLMGFRHGIRRMLSKSGPFDSDFFERCESTAPIRYHTLATSAFGKDPVAFRSEPEKDLAISSYVGPGGLWFTSYDKSVEERSKDASVAYAQGPDLFTFKPVVGGGAKAFHYRGYQILSVDDIDEKTFQETKRKVEAILTEGSTR